MDTIFALATAPGKAGVAVIRVSGVNAGQALISLSGKDLPCARVATICKLFNPKSADLIDESLVIFFQAPASFTGEDVVELHVHGGRAVIAEMLLCLSEMPNLRMADAGEFSRRAFLNDKMDLTEAEGLADLIDAETKMQAKLALLQTQGALGALYDNWRNSVLSTLAYIEAYIDFPDEEIPSEIINIIDTKVAQLITSINGHLIDNRRGERLRAGLDVAIIGPPNAGKSSLLNLLAMREVAIVSEHAGTTRDIIEVHLDLAGYPVTIADTAGIHDATMSIEAEGIRRALVRAKNADLKILVFDAVAFASRTDRLQLLNRFIQFIDCNSIVVFNKIELIPNFNIEFDVPCYCFINTSFLNNSGVDEILTKIRIFAEENLNFSADPLITRQRHRSLLEDAMISLHSFSLDKPIELAGEDLRCAAVAIGKITGRINVEDVLDKIFLEFCIGK